MGMEFILDGESDPALEVDDELENTIEEIGGWSYLLKTANAKYEWDEAIVSPLNLVAFADGCVVLAEQYGSEGRSFTRAWRDADDHVRSSEVSGPRLRSSLMEMGRFARTMHEAGRSVTLRGERGWAQETMWKSADDFDHRQ
jgi:hypothetical protein